MILAYVFNITMEISKHPHMKAYVSLHFTRSHEWFLSHIPPSEIPSLVDLTSSNASSPALIFPMCVCQQLYKELSQCYQALTSSEANLRQSHQELNSLVAQKDQHILQLQAQLQQQQEQIQLQQQQQQQAQHTALYPSPNRQTNFKVITVLILHHLPAQLLLKFIKCIATPG